MVFPFILPILVKLIKTSFSSGSPSTLLCTLCLAVINRFGVIKKPVPTTLFFSNIFPVISSILKFIKNTSLNKLFHFL